jgi:hypothetical protein
MSTTLNVTRRVNIISTEASATIDRGEAVTAWGKLATSPVGMIGVAEFDIAAGEAGAAVCGRVHVKYNGTPGANVELSVHTDGTLDAAVSTDIVVGYQLEAVIVDSPALGIAWVEGPSYVKP